MDGVLSQEEINALLNEPGAEASDSAENELSDAQKDAIGEIANISMGTAATTLFSLVNHKVEISTPVVSYGTWDDIVQEYEKPCVFIRIAYTVGLDGSNILVLREHDVKVITDLMMGGDGTNTDGELGELHLSAISEAMNQMMGSAATSLSSMLNRKIDISPPNATVINLQEDIDEAEIDSFLTGKFVKISFHMEIGDLVDSTIMQLYPISFAKDISKSKPTSCAIAGRCSILFVEHPSAISTVNAFKIASFVIISLGRISFLYISMTAIPACFARRILSEYTAGIVPLPCKPIPRASVKQFMEFAVYIPEQEPQVGHTFSSYSHTSSSLMVPAA